MNHIIVDFQPFDMQQTILVYVDGTCVKTANVDIDRIINVVNGLRKQYNINQIDLCGNQDYLMKFKAAMNTTFEDNKCNVDIIRR